jgi:hypothetical protein
MRISICLSLALALLASGAVRAEGKKKSKLQAEEDAERTITVIVPQSQINLTPPPEPPARPVEFALSLSSYVPENFVRGSFSNQSSRFEAGEAPYASINRVSQFAKLQNGIGFSSKLGLSYLSLQRTVSLRTGDIPAGTGDESLNMFMARVGVESDWAGLFRWGLEPNISLSVLPSWASATQTAVEGNVNGFGYPLEGTVGLLWRTKVRFAPIHGNMSLGISGQVVNGQVAGSSVTGTGVLGEFRLSL